MCLICLVLNNLDCAVILNTRAIASSSSAELHWINTAVYFRKGKYTKLLSKLGLGLNVCTSLWSAFYMADGSECFQSFQH